MVENRWIKQFFLKQINTLTKSLYLFMTMMCPKLSFSLNSLTLSRMQMHAEITFTSNIFLKSSVLPSANGMQFQSNYVMFIWKSIIKCGIPSKSSDLMTPALFTNTSKRPIVSLIHLKIDKTSVSLVTSHFFGMILPFECGSICFVSSYKMQFNEETSNAKTNYGL